MNISKIFISDAETLASIHSNFNLPWEKPWSKKSYEELVAQPSITGFKAEEEGDVYGFILIQYTGEESDILFIGVRNDQQGRGIGSLLLKHAEVFLKDIGVINLYLDVCSDNNKAVYFYNKYLYVSTSLRKKYYTHNSRSYDALTMKKVL